MKKIKAFLSRLLQSNRIIMVFSLIISFCIWFALTQRLNPISDRPISNVPINFSLDNTAVEGLGLEIVSGQEDAKVTVTINGKTEEISAASASDIMVTPLLSSVKGPGEYELPLVASKNNTFTSYDIVSIEPSTITLRFDKVETRSFKVTARAAGVSAAKGLIAEDAALSDAANYNIDIKGPQTDLNRIASVVARADVNKTLSETEEFEADIVLYDANGKEISQSSMTLSFTKAKITVAISRSKNVPIRATFVNAPAAYEENPLKYSLSMDDMTVIGPPDIIDELTQIELSPINFDEITPDNTSFTCEVIFPASVKSYDNVNQILVTLDLSDMTTESFTVSQFRAVNVPDGMQASSRTELKNVMFVGRQASLDKIQAKNIYMEADLADYKTRGEYTVTVYIRVSNVDDVWAIGEYKAIVTLS